MSKGDFLRQTYIFKNYVKYYIEGDAMEVPTHLILVEQRKFIQVTILLVVVSDVCHELQRSSMITKVREHSGKFSIDQEFSACCI